MIKKVLVSGLAMVISLVSMSNAAFASVLSDHGVNEDICTVLGSQSSSDESERERIAQLMEAAGCNTTTTVPSSANSLINVLLSITGVVAVVVMIIGGIYYLMSNGDPSKAKRGRDTIIYGLIGLLVALLASAIVNFVIFSVPE